MRNFPKQARSEQTVRTILNTAKILFSEYSFDEITTNKIAEKAKIPIGSLYRFFPNKEDILESLIEDYLDELKKIYSSLFTEKLLEYSLDELVDQVISAFIKLSEANPHSFNIFNSTRSRKIRELTQKIDQESISKLSFLLQIKNRTLSAEEINLFAKILYSTASALLTLYENPSTEKQRAQLIVEMKNLFIRYLKPILS